MLTGYFSNFWFILKNFQAKNLVKPVILSILKPFFTYSVNWLGFTCGVCKFCLNEQENLCDNAGFIDYTIDGGYAEYTVANENTVFLYLPRMVTPSGLPCFVQGL